MKSRDCPLPSVRISCAKCGRQGLHLRDNFVELVEAETDLADALQRVSAD